jgi:uncharacterized protein with PQ loop repeat
MEDLLAAVASGCFLIRLLPQPIRLVRTGVAAGVSPLWALNGAVVTVAWAVHGYIADLPVVVWVSVLALVPGVWTVVLLRRQTTGRDLALAGAWVATLVAAGIAGVFGVALALGVLVTQGPQVLEALRDDDLSGLAPTTWWVALLDAGTWGAYGLVVGDVALLGYAVTLTGSSVVVLLRIAWTRRAGTTQHSAQLRDQPT